MKKLIITSTLLLFILVSCEENKTPAIVNRWKATSYKINGSEMINTIPGTTNVIEEFKSDNTYKLTSDQYPESSGGQNGTYTLNASEVTTTTSSGTYTYTIVELTTGSLKLKRTYDLGTGESTEESTYTKL